MVFFYQTLFLGVSLVLFVLPHVHSAEPAIVADITEPVRTVEPVVASEPAEVAPSAAPAKPVHDLIILNATESRDEVSRAVTYGLINALVQKAAPIVMPSELLENLCFWQADPDIAEMISLIKEEAKTAKDPEALTAKVNELLRQSPAVSEKLNKYEAVASDLLKALSFTELNDNAW